MPKLFDEKYNDVVKKMCKDLVKDGLKMMTWTYPNGWKFKLSIPQSKFTALRNKESVS